MFKPYIVVFSMFLLHPMGAAYADILSLDDALRATYTACVDIDDNLHDLKVLAGINTAVTAVGTAAGVGASVTGFVKSNKDISIEQLEEQLKIELNKIPPSTDQEWDEFLAEF
jgi:hypothetical protein